MIQDAPEKIIKALVIIEKVVREKKFTIGDMREARTLLLSAVRHDIDDLACGHMPDKRYY